MTSPADIKLTETVSHIGVQPALARPWAAYSCAALAMRKAGYMSGVVAGCTMGVNDCCCTGTVYLTPSLCSSLLITDRMPWRCVA